MKIKINEQALRKIITESISKTLNESFDPYIMKTNNNSELVSQLIGKQIVFKTGNGTTGFVIDDVQANGNGWFLRAKREDGRAIYVGNIEDLLKGSITAPSAYLFNFDVSTRPQQMGKVSIA